MGGSLHCLTVSVYVTVHIIYIYAVVICVSSYMSESKFSVIWCVFVDKSVHNYFIVCIFSAKKKKEEEGKCCSLC